MIEAEDVRIFIKGLTLNVNTINFDEQFITFPAQFSDLRKLIKVSNTECVKLERPPGKLKDFIKKSSNNDKCTENPDSQKLGVQKRKSNMTKFNEPSPKTRKCEHGLKLTVEESDTEIDFDSYMVTEAIGRLNAFFEKDNLLKLEKVLDTSIDEAELEIGLGIHLISKLAGKAYTNTRKCNYKCPCGCGEFLQGNDKMWIGSEHTWYGELDILAGNPETGDAVAVMIGKEVEKDNDDDDGDDIDDDDDDDDDDGEEGVSELELSPGDRTNVEVKCFGRNEDMKQLVSRVKCSGCNRDINQLVSQAVVFAFTEYNQHREKGKCIPSVYIDRDAYRFALYNPVDDQLVVSNLLSFRKKEFNPKNLFRPIIILWLIINYRIFFARSPETLPLYLKSKFQEKMLNLQSFKVLRDYSGRILPKSECIFDNFDDSLNAVDLLAYDWFMKKL